ncbi:MAG: class I SAM-dependent methyltransferase [Bacteroidales bacterium]|nr:class I SAM-dependent methyltransferase [Bacteroidales bacterium]
MRNLTDYTENYYNQPFEYIQVAYRKKKVIELIQKHRHEQVLEVGCGLDPFFNYFDDFQRLTILEPSKDFYDNALNLIAERANLKSRVVAINAFLEDSINQLADHNYEYVIISCLLHEIEDTSFFLNQLRRVLNPNTIVHIDVPNAFSFHRVLAFEMGLIDSVFEMSSTNIQFQQQRVFDLDSLKKLIEEHNFRIIDAGSYFVKPFTHKQMSVLIDNEIINPRVLDGLYNMIKYMPDLGSEIFTDFTLND